MHHNNLRVPNYSNALFFIQTAQERLTWYLHKREINKLHQTPPLKPIFLLYGIHGTHMNVIFMIDNLLLKKKGTTTKSLLLNH